MVWKDIEEYVKQKIDSEVAAARRFNPYTIRLFGGVVQQEISTYTKSIIQTSNITTAIGGVAYDLPLDCYEVFNAKYDTTPLDQNQDRPMVGDPVVGTPFEWFLFSDKIGLYPAPSAVKTLEIWNFRKTPEYVFSVENTADAGCTDVTISFAATSVTINVTGGADSGNTIINCAHASTDTVVEVVNKINSVFTTIKATINSNMPTTTTWSQLSVEVRGPVKIKNARDLCMENPRIPVEMHKLIPEGIIHNYEHKDKEYSAEQITNSYYYRMLEKARIDYFKHHSAHQNHAIKKVYPSAGVPSINALGLVMT